MLLVSVILATFSSGFQIVRSASEMPGIIVPSMGYRLNSVAAFVDATSTNLVSASLPAKNARGNLV